MTRGRNIPWKNKLLLPHVIAAIGNKEDVGAARVWTTPELV